MQGLWAWLDRTDAWVEPAQERALDWVISRLSWYWREQTSLCWLIIGIILSLIIMFIYIQRTQKKFDRDMEEVRKSIKSEGDND